jgi:hypothetical protein
LSADFFVVFLEMYFKFINVNSSPFFGRSQRKLECEKSDGDDNSTYLPSVHISMDITQ